MTLNAEANIKCIAQRMGELNTSVDSLVEEIVDNGGGENSGPATHISSTITTGGTAQTLLAATPKKFFYIRNTSAGDLRITYNGVTPTASIGQLLKTGEAWENPDHWCPQDIIKIWGATTAQAYEAIYS